MYALQIPITPRKKYLPLLNPLGSFIMAYIDIQAHLRRSILLSSLARLPQSRFLLGFGGLGIGMMLAHTLVYLGISIALIGVISSISIYYAHLRSAYLTLASRSDYVGVPVNELLIVSFMTIAMFIISVIVFVIVINHDDEKVPHARFVYHGISFESIKDSQDKLLLIHFKNTVCCLHHMWQLPVVLLLAIPH